jgi:hypothetical protein
MRITTDIRHCAGPAADAADAPSPPAPRSWAPPTPVRPPAPPGPPCRRGPPPTGHPGAASCHCLPMRRPPALRRPPRRPPACGRTIAEPGPGAVRVPPEARRAAAAGPLPERPSPPPFAARPQPVPHPCTRPGARPGPVTRPRCATATRQDVLRLPRLRRGALGVLHPHDSGRDGCEPRAGGVRGRSVPGAARRPNEAAPPAGGAAWGPGMRLRRGSPAVGPGMSRVAARAPAPAPRAALAPLAARRHGQPGGPAPAHAALPPLTRRAAAFPLLPSPRVQPCSSSASSRRSPRECRRPSPRSSGGAFGRGEGHWPAAGRPLQRRRAEAAAAQRRRRRRKPVAPAQARPNLGAPLSPSPTAPLPSPAASSLPAAPQADHPIQLRLQVSPRAAPALPFCRRPSAAARCLPLPPSCTP